MEKKWKEFFKFKDKIFKLLENAKKNQLIKRNNEALLIINTNSKFIKSLNIKKLLMVGKVKYGLENKVKYFESKKCERCWNHFEKEKLKLNNICFRCHEVISQ
jgi:isoleucyl-tRNA synthetase